MMRDVPQLKLVVADRGDLGAYGNLNLPELPTNLIGAQGSGFMVISLD